MPDYPYLTPTEVARRHDMHRREVIAKCHQWGIPIFEGLIDDRLFAAMNVLLVRIGDLEDALKRIYLGSGVGIQSARAIARKALYGDSEA